MALTWDLTKIKDYEEITKGEEWVITDALIWATMFVGIGSITEKNAEDFYKRVHLREKIVGSHLRSEDGPIYLTEEDVKRRIGLETNVSDYTHKQFNDRVLQFYYGK